ncbi:M23 family metallopeptidase [Blastococcus aggregatus]|nr:M23 family metallopeptidase [Blastococcus aggregatus]
MRSGLAVVLTALAVAALAPAPSTAGPLAPDATGPPVGAWTAPLGGEPPVTRPFEPPAHAYGPGHRGADLGGAPGAPVLAAGDGVVAFAGMVAGRPVVSIDHAGGLRTTYEPVDASVGAGQRVTRGSRIGTLSPGHAGCPADACLHWGLRRGEVYLDPLQLLAVPRVRLLPLRGLRRCRRAWCAGGARPWCAAGRCGSRSPRARGRCRRG